MKTRLIFSAVIAAFAMLCSSANAQGVIAPGHVIGNGNAAAHTATDAPLSSVMDQAMCPTQGDVPLRGASVWACAVPPTGFYGTVAANKVLAGPTTGSPAASAYRFLVGSDLPLPSASSLGGVESITSIAHNWIAYIDTSGVPHQSQPAFTDISGTLASTQCPTPTVSAIGCVEAINSQSHNWIAYVDTSGVPHQSQPTIGDLASIGAFSLIGNTTSGSAAPGAFTVGGLTNKTVPAATDILLIQDQAAGGALKYCTLAQCQAATSSGVSSIDSKTGAFTTGNGLDSTGGNLIEVTAARRTLPTKQVFLTGSGTYTTPTNALWIEIDLVGGGAGGGGGGLSNPSGTAGNPTCWNTTGAACTTPVYEAGGGVAGSASGGAGGTISGSSSCDWQAVGGGGGGGSVGDTSTSAPGGVGGSSSLGGGGASVVGNVGGTAGANTGGGGAGGGINSSSAAALGGGGGGSGATCHVIVGSPASTYTYAVGGTATGGTNGTDGSAGGPGASGHIVVYEHYGS